MKNLAILFALAASLTSFSQESNSPLVSFEDYERLMSEVKEHRKTRLVNLDEFNQMSLKDEVYILDTRSKEMYDRKHVKGAIHLNFADFTQENLDALFPNRNATILIYCNNNFYNGIDIDPISLKELLLQDQNFASKVSRPDYKLTELPQPVVSETIQLSDLTETRINSVPQTDEEIEMLERTSLEIPSRQGVPAEIARQQSERTGLVPEKPITLALNIPTYINLYGYGYRNVYELSELILVNDPRIQFEGTEVTRIKN